MSRPDQPALRVLSLGAGVQSTTIALLSAAGHLPLLDAAIFSDTGWEPQAVYDHLERLNQQVLKPAGIPLHVVGNGNLRTLVTTPQGPDNPTGRFTRLPMYLVAPESETPVLVTCPTCNGEAARALKAAERVGAEDDLKPCPTCEYDGTVPDPSGATRPLGLDERTGMGQRGCTRDHKVYPIKRKVRELLGATVNPLNGRVGPVRGGAWAEQWIGISKDEVQRAKDSDVLYARHRFPLLDLGWTRNDCTRYLTREGWESTPKSACIGCPFHGNRQWRDLRDNHPAEWADAVEFDAAIRTPEVRAHLHLTSEAFLHRSRVPLSEAPIDRLQRDENKTYDLLEAIRDVEWDEAEEPPGCSPFTCRADGL